jgi:hypothetical protein
VCVCVLVCVCVCVCVCVSSHWPPCQHPCLHANTRAHRPRPRPPPQEPLPAKYAAWPGPGAGEARGGDEDDEEWRVARDLHCAAQARLDISDAVMELEESGCLTPMLRRMLQTFFRLCRLAAAKTNTEFG